MGWNFCVPSFGKEKKLVRSQAIVTSNIPTQSIFQIIRKHLYAFEISHFKLFSYRKKTSISCFYRWPGAVTSHPSLPLAYPRSYWMQGHWECRGLCQNLEAPSLKQKLPVVSSTYILGNYWEVFLERASSIPRVWGPQSLLLGSSRNWGAGKKRRRKEDPWGSAFVFCFFWIPTECCVDLELAQSCLVPNKRLGNPLNKWLES